jgi:hypothetical protein
MSDEFKRDAKYQLRHDALGLGPFVIERVEIVGEFETREAAREYMLNLVRPDVEEDDRG